MLNLYRYQIILLLLLGLSLCDSFGQKQTKINLPESDAQKLHYGFSIGLHNAGLVIDHDELYASSPFDSLHSIMAKKSFGFSLGFITEYKLHEQFTIRLLPKVSFYEFSTDFNYTSGRVDNQLIEATFIEFPLLLKYKSERHQNFRVYVIGGISPGIEASGKRRKERSTNKLLIQDFNLTADFGLGIDMYYPMFKFSPEIRFSKGLLDLLKPDNFGYSDPVNRMSSNVISIYLQFSD